jgi:hypothetical protein
MTAAYGNGSTGGIDARPISVPPGPRRATGETDPVPPWVGTRSSKGDANHGWSRAERPVRRVFVAAHRRQPQRAGVRRRVLGSADHDASGGGSYPDTDVGPHAHTSPDAYAGSHAADHDGDSDWGAALGREPRASVRRCVILCLKSASGCTTDANLQAISDSSGKFKIHGVPEGIYVVLYSPRGAPGSSASGLDVALDDQTAHCLGVAFASIEGSVSDSCRGSIPFFDDSMLRALSAQIANVSAIGPRSDTSFESGRVCSSKYGLCLDFEASTPVTAEITAGSTTSVKITVG